MWYLKKIYIQKEPFHNHSVFFNCNNCSMFLEYRTICVWWVINILGSLTKNNQIILNFNNPLTDLSIFCVSCQLLFSKSRENTHAGIEGVKSPIIPPGAPGAGRSGMDGGMLGAGRFGICGIVLGCSGAPIPLGIPVGMPPPILRGGRGALWGLGDGGRLRMENYLYIHTGRYLSFVKLSVKSQDYNIISHTKKSHKHGPQTVYTSIIIIQCQIFQLNSWDIKLKNCVL